MPLHFAVYRGHVEVIKKLLMNGADPNTQDENGNSPLNFAVNKGRPKGVNILYSLNLYV